MSGVQNLINDNTTDLNIESAVGSKLIWPIVAFNISDTVVIGLLNFYRHNLEELN